MNFSKHYIKENEEDEFQIWIDSDMDDTLDTILDPDGDDKLDDIDDDDTENESCKDCDEYSDDCEKCLKQNIKPNKDTDEIDEATKIPPAKKRKLARIKNAAISKATDGEFYDWPLKKRAVFLAKWMFQVLPGFKGKMVKRTPPANVADIVKRLKKASKNMRLNKKIRARGKVVAARTKGKN